MKTGNESGKDGRTFTVDATGLFYHETELNMAVKHRDLSIFLEREPENEYDSNAIAVKGEWTCASGRKKAFTLGYLPAAVAAAIVLNDRFERMSLVNWRTLPKDKPLIKRIELTLFDPFDEENDR